MVDAIRAAMYRTSGRFSVTVLSSAECGEDTDASTPTVSYRAITAEAVAIDFSSCLANQIELI
jgi:hypothetical protein